MQPALNFFDDGGRSRPAKGSFEFDAAKLGWIMAGRHHHATGEPSAFRFVGNVRCGKGTIEDLRLKPVAGKHLPYPAGKLRCHETAVVAHQNRTGSWLLRFHVIGNRLRHDFHVRKCKVTTDDASPSIGTELDLGQSEPRSIGRIRTKGLSS